MAGLDDRDDPVRDLGMLDTGSPRVVGQRPATEPDVATGIDRVVGDPVLLEELAAAVDRPALDEPGWIDLEQRCVASVEEAAGLLPKLVTARQHSPNVGMALAQIELVPVQPADLTLRAVGAEPCVDRPEPVEQLLDRQVVAVVADIDDDRHPHDLRDPTPPRKLAMRAAHGLTISAAMSPGSHSANRSTWRWRRGTPAICSSGTIRSTMPGRPADVDVTLVDVRDELSEMARREKVARRGVAVVADDVFDPSATRGRDRVELAAEDDVRGLRRRGRARRRCRRSARGAPARV